MKLWMTLHWFDGICLSIAFISGLPELEGRVPGLPPSMGVQEGSHTLAAVDEVAALGIVGHVLVQVPPDAPDAVARERDPREQHCRGVRTDYAGRVRHTQD